VGARNDYFDAEMLQTILSEFLLLLLKTKKTEEYHRKLLYDQKNARI